MTASSRLAANVKDRFAENLISGPRCQKIFNQAVEAGVSGLARKKGEVDL